MQHLAAQFFSLGGGLVDVLHLDVDQPAGWQARHRLLHDAAHRALARLDHCVHRAVFHRHLLFFPGEELKVELVRCLYIGRLQFHVAEIVCHCPFLIVMACAGIG